MQMQEEEEEDEEAVRISYTLAISSGPKITMVDSISFLAN